MAPRRADLWQLADVDDACLPAWRVVSSRAGGISRPRTGAPWRPLRTPRRRKNPGGEISSYSVYADFGSFSRPATGPFYSNSYAPASVYGTLPAVSRPPTGAVYSNSVAAASRPVTGNEDVMLPDPPRSARLTAAHEVAQRLAELDGFAKVKSPPKSVKSRPKSSSRNATPRKASRSGTPRRDSLTESLEPSSAEMRSVPVVVESPMSLMITLGQETERVFPHTWLVLCSTTTIDAASNCLHPDAGGGSIVDDEDRTLTICRVADLRLNSTGAEANFQRSSRSASLIGLRHAAFILTLFGSREKHLGSLTPMDPVPLPDPFVSARVNERFRKVESIVAFRAATASQRAASRERENSQGEASNSKNSRLPPLTGKLSGSQKSSARQSANQKGLQALEDFNRFAEHKFGNTVRAWFMLDPEGKMTIGQKQFARACDDIGFTGNVLALWRYLDSDQSGQITILELDNVAAVNLAEFKQVIRNEFQDSAQQVFMYMDDNRSDRLFRDEFVKGMRLLGFKATAAARLFQMFDRERLGSITSKDLLFLDRWHPPPYLFSRPDMAGLENFKHALCSIYKSLLRAWRQVLDKDSTMRVSWDEFCGVCKQLEKSPVPGIPKTLDQMAGVWRALDEDCGGWIALRELDREAFQCLAGFKMWSMRTHGAVITAFQMLSGGNARLTESELPNVTDYDFNGSLFIQGLNLGNNVTVHKKPDERDVTKIHTWEVPFLVEKDVRFLDKWDLDWEDQETDAKHGHTDSNATATGSSARAGG